MRILFLGDVVGEPERRLMQAHLPELRREFAVDFLVVNGENAAHGNGITERIASDWLDNLGGDVITTGNHAFRCEGHRPLFRTGTEAAAACEFSTQQAGAGLRYTPGG